MITDGQLKEFFEILEGPMGCNFRDDEEHDMLFECDGGNNKEKSIQILQDMGIGIVDIVHFLVDCDRNGGHCDCEIIFNAQHVIMKLPQPKRIKTERALSGLRGFVRWLIGDSFA